MRINIDYLKGLTGLFLESNQHFLTTSELIESGYDITTGEGAFHALLLAEQGYISNLKNETGTPESIGLFVTRSGDFDYTNSKLRLTTDGMEFALSLDKDDVFERLKNLSNEPISVIKDIGVELLKGYAKKKFGLSV
ncbi:hypothetical protein [Salmonella bongori]|uniref:hypothetical protein n=1 Tax=Salmonella bongori TaxID=54736 RepID=UPI0009A9D3D7|nr:hypothetical protein [Salmonella bongori]EGE4660834.1 hypothetical protein [Salmonella bongori serovar 48:i:- str. 94-0708]HAB1661509.1 hypothetical protein [Salmonella bongori]